MIAASSLHMLNLLAIHAVLLLPCCHRPGRDQLLDPLQQVSAPRPARPLFPGAASPYRIDGPVRSYTTYCWHYYDENSGICTYSYVVGSIGLLLPLLTLVLEVRHLKAGVLTCHG